MNELITIADGNAVLNAETASKIAEFEKAVKSIKEQEDALKQAILSEMEAKGIIKIDSSELLISYVAETDKEVFDSKSFKKDFPELYDGYVKMTPVKANIRIKVR